MADPYDSGQADALEIEITPAMIEAGLGVMLNHEIHLKAPIYEDRLEIIVCEIYRRMLAFSPKRSA